MSGSFALELFLRSLPDEDEVDTVLQRVRDLDGRSSSLSEELPDGLGQLLYDTTRDPRDISPKVPNEPYRPGLSRANVVHRDGDVRSIAVRLPYAERIARSSPRNPPAL